MVLSHVSAMINSFYLMSNAHTIFKSNRVTSSLQEALSLDPKVFIDSEVNLKQSHRYYTQVQLQLYGFKCDRCIFLHGHQIGCA